MDTYQDIIKRFRAELKEIRAECCLGENLNNIYAQLIVLLNNYALQTKHLPKEEQQYLWKRLASQLSPGVFVLSKEWREICKKGRSYLQTKVDIESHCAHNTLIQSARQAKNH